MILCPVDAVLILEDRRTWQAHFATMRTRLQSEANLRVVTGWNILCHVRLCEVLRLRSLPPATRQHAIKSIETFYRLDSWDNVRTNDFYKNENKNALFENVTKYNRQTLAEGNCTPNMTCNVRITYQWGAFVQPLCQCKDNKYYIFWGCVCSLWYPACNAHAPHCHLWLVRLYHFFATLFHKRHDFRNEIIEYKMCVFIFSTTFVWNTAHALKNWAKYDQKCILSLHVKWLFFSDFNETWILSTDFRKYNIKFHENPTRGGGVVPCGRTDKHSDTTQLIDVFRNFANPPTKHYIPVYENITKNTYFVEIGQLIRELIKRLSLKHNMPVQWFLYPCQIIVYIILIHAFKRLLSF